MSKQRVRRTMCALGIILFFTFLTTHALGQFRGPKLKGAQKKETVLNRTFPARVYVIGTEIQVQGKIMKGVDPSYAGRLASMAESKILGNAPRFKPNNLKPETIISCEISFLNADEKWEDTAITRQRKVGDKQVWDEKKKKNKTEPVYENYQETQRFKVIKGSININYQVTEVKTGRVLDSDLLSARYDENGVVYGDRTLALRKEPGLLERMFSPLAGGKKNAFADGKGAPSQEEVKQMLMEEIVYQIVARLAPPSEPVKVLLPRGKLDEISDLGTRGLWQEFLDKLENKEPSIKPEEEAYRLYGIGLAFEALAYKADTLDRIVDLIVKAQLKYDEAYNNKPGEEYFLDPKKRIKEAREQYEKIKNHLAEEARVKGASNSKSIEDYSKGQPGTGQGQTNGSSTQPPNPVPAALTNEMVIELKRKGMDDIELIKTINDARPVTFDLSAQGKLTLLNNGISSRVITAMRLRQEALRKKSRSTTKR